MTKKEFLKQGVDELRAALLSMFEDPDGELAEMTKQPLIKFAQENWANIAPNLEQDEAPETEDPEDPEVETEEVQEDPLDLEPEPTVDESVAIPDESEEEEDGWQGNPGTNLHTGAPGNVEQRVGTRDLA